MLKKVLAGFGYFGPAALLAGYLYYSINATWDWKAQVLVYGGAGLLVVYLVTNIGNLRAAFRKRTVRQGSAAGAILVLVLAILVLLNFLNFRHHKRADLTENQLFALSDQSRKVLSNLREEIRVMGFFQEESRARSFEDLMREYRYVSSKIVYEVVDPQKDPGKVSQYNITKERQVAVVSGVKTELIDDFAPDSGEEKITNGIIKVTRKGEKVAYFLQGHGERDTNDSGAQGFSQARDEVQKQHYQVKTYNLAQENKLPEDAALIVSAGPQVNFFPNEVDLLQQYLAAGGKFLLMVDTQTDFAMEDFLTQYGLALGHNVVLDTSGTGRFFGLGPAAPLVATYTDHAVTKDLKGIMTFFPMAQSVKTSDSPLGYQTTALLSTSPNSWGETNLEGTRAAFDEGKDTKGPLNLAAVATRATEGKPAESEKSDTAVPKPADLNTGSKPGEKLETRLVLFGDSDFASNAYFGSAANGDLFLMTVSWLAADEDLIAIRPKDPKDRRVTLTLANSRLAFWGLVILLPVATLVFGISVWYRRR